MTEGVNRQWTLASRPDGYPAVENFALVESPIEDPGPGEVLVQSMWQSLDPYMRAGWRRRGRTPLRWRSAT